MRITAEELLQRYAAGERNFSRVRLPGVRLLDVNLSRAIFREADFSDVIFDWSNLSHADLSYASLRRARFGEASLGRANLEGADLSEAVFGQTSFKGANLSHAKLKGTILTESSFKNANLTCADLSGARNFSLLAFPGAIFYETIMPDGSIRSDNS